MRLLANPLYRRDASPVPALVCPLQSAAIVPALNATIGDGGYANERRERLSEHSGAAHPVGDDAGGVRARGRGHLLDREPVGEWSREAEQARATRNRGACP